MVNIDQRNCVTSRKNLGLPDCIIQLERPTGFILTPKGWAINLATETFNKAYVDEQIQLGNFVPVTGAVEFTNNTPETTTEEYQGGIMSAVRKGLPLFSFKFIKGGIKFISALSSYDSQQAFDVLLLFSKGEIAGANNGTQFTGFDLGMLDTGTYMYNDGATSGGGTVQMQLIDANQYNLNTAVLTPDVLDFKPNTDLQPITDVVITDVVADVSENKVYFKATYAMNKSYPLGGIEIASLRSIIEGSVDTIVALSLSYNSLTGLWSYTPTATLGLGDTVVVQLYDSVNAVAVAKIGTRFYKGASAQVLATA
jgi:hypothetical protein